MAWFNVLGQTRSLWGYCFGGEANETPTSVIVFYATATVQKLMLHDHILDHSDVCGETVTFYVSTISVKTHRMSPSLFESRKQIINNVNFFMLLLCQIFGTLVNAATVIRLHIVIFHNPQAGIIMCFVCRNLD